MLANICTELAGAIATCNCVSVNGSEPTKLVSSDPVLRSFGFRAERYVKGPVTVEIDLSRLSTQFTIAAVVMRGAVRDSSSYTGDFFVGDGDQEKFIGRLTFGGATSSNPSPINALIRSANKSITDIISGVRGSYVSEALKVNEFSDSAEMHNSLFLKRNLKTLSVKISNLHGGISAGINWLEVWSECHATPYTIPSHLPSLYSGIVLTDLYAGVGDKSLSDSNSQHSREEASQPHVPRDIPSEFLDQVTFEVMKDPVTLPSGNAVDFKTIQKLFDQGRGEQKEPLDPFTGLSLEHYIPVINVNLRDRIKDFESGRVGINSNGINSNGYKQLNAVLDTKFDNSSDDAEIDTDQVRKKRLAYFQNATAPSKRNKLESRTHKEVLFTTRLPFEDKLPIKSPEVIDLTLDDD